MNSKHSNDLTLFNEALDISPPEARAAYLDRVCGTDAALRHKIDSLLAAYEKASDRFEDLDGNAPTLVSETRGDLGGPGSVIGRYKLLQQIGEGGMGVVYMAEQEEPVRRRVALKVASMSASLAFILLLIRDLDDPFRGVFNVSFAPFRELANFRG